MAITGCIIHLAINHVLPFNTSSLWLTAIYIFLLGLCVRTRQELGPAGDNQWAKEEGSRPKGAQEEDN